MQQRLKSAPGATGAGIVAAEFLGFRFARWPDFNKRIRTYVRIAILMAPPLPVSVAQVAEALWMQASEEGRLRALSEQRMTDSALVTGMLKKEQATRGAAARRLSTVEAELSTARQVKAPVRAVGPPSAARWR
jgi:hypothetical protein